MKRGKSGVAIAVILVAAMLLTFALVACEKEVVTTIAYWVDGEFYHAETVTGTEATTSSVDDPYEPGYRFDGWYTSESFVSRFYFEDYASNPNRSDISVYAKMTKLGGSGEGEGDGEGEEEPPVEEAETYTVTFDVNGGDREISSREFEVGSVMSLPTPTREGYRFVCWRDAWGEEYDNTSVMPDEDLRLIAVWEKVVSTFEDEYVTFKPATEGRKQSSDFYEGYDGVQEYLFVELTSDDLGGMNRVGVQNNFDLTQNVEMEYSVNGDYTLLWYEGSWNNPNGAQMFTLNYGSNVQLLTVSEGQRVVKRYLVDIYVLHDYYVSLYTDIFADEPYDKVRVIENERFDSATEAKQVADFEFDGRVYYNSEAGEYVPYTYSDPVKSDISLYQTYKDKSIEIVDEEGKSIGTLDVEPYTQYSLATTFIGAGQDFLGLKVMGEDDESDEDDWFFTDLNGRNAVNYLSAEENFDTLTAVFAPKQYYQYLDEEDGTKLHVAETIPVAFYADETRREMVDVVYVPEGWATAVPERAPVSDGNEVFKGWQTYVYNANLDEWFVVDFDLDEAVTEPTAVFGEFQDLTVYGSASSVHAVKLDGTTTFETSSGTFRMYLPVEGSYTLTVSGDLKFTLNRYLSVNAATYTVDGTKSVTIDYFREPGTTVTESGGFVSFTVGTLYGSGFDVTLTGPNASVTEAAADQTQLFGAGDEVTLLRAVETEGGQYFKAWKDAGGNEVAGEDLTVTWSKSGDSVLTAEYYSPIVWQKDVLSALRALSLSELGITAADADGNALEVTATLLDASGEVVTDISECGGETLTVEVSSSQSDEGRTFEATIEIKVYGMPTIAYQHEYWYYQEGEDVTTMFSAVDSFGQPLEVTVNVEEQTEDGVYVLVTATDAVGNTAISEGQLRVVPSGGSWLRLYLDEEYIGDTVVEYGEAYQLPTLPGYDFRGWQLNGADVTDESGNSLAPWDKASGAYTLTADADLITYAVNYDLDGGVNAATNPASYTIEDDDITLAAPTKTGYTFVGWTSDEAGEEAVTTLDTSACEDVELWAQWTVNSYTATFVADGETVDEVEFTVEDEALTEPTVPSKVGYTGEWQEYDIVADDITVEAVYTAIVYGIEYVGLKDGTHSNASEYTIESETIVLQDASRVGYDFVGWYDGEQEVIEIASGSTGDKTLTAKWQAITYTISYDGLMNGTHSNASEYTIESETIVLQDASRVGYDFVGWYDGEQKVTEIASGSHGDRTLTAKWQAIGYTIAYEGLADGTHSNVSEYTIESETIVLQDASREGYDFVGWYDGEQEVTEIASGSMGDKTLTAKWQAITYTISYDGLMNGTHSNASEYTIESDTIVLRDASRAGYDFVGWYDGKQKVSEIESGSHGDKTLTAKWQIQEYSVDYSLDGGINAAGNPTSYTVLTLGGADGSVPLADPSKKGAVLGYTANGDGAIKVTLNAYTFLGWYRDASFEQKVTSLTLDLGDVTLYAKWGEQPTEVQTETKQYVRVDENNEMDEQGEYILFGEYPQTIKLSDVTVGDVADEDGYYLGSDGERYAKVVADPYGSGYTFSNGSAVTEGNTYYFKVEPIRWRILSESDGSAFILADGIIANHYYHHTTSSTTIEGETVYSNNYKHSDIRAWLNGEFLNTAFGEAAQGLIETTEVDNSTYSTGNYSSNQYACENTFDKVFLLSYREVINSKYGFSSDGEDYDTARQMTVSDYARSTGAYMNTSDSYFGCGNWWLRRPYRYSSNIAGFVYSHGSGGSSFSVVRDGDNGVVPAMNITL